MKNYILMFIFFVVSNLTFAKIVPPTPIVPIVNNGIEYSAPHENMGCIYAKDAKTKELLWWRQIYAVKFVPNLERDVQFVFITNIKLDGNDLIIANDKNDVYKLNTNTLEVVSVGLAQSLPGTWLHSENNIYFRKGTKKFGLSRFRMKYVFKENGVCKWLNLAPDDGHFITSGIWKINAKNQQAINIYDNKSNLVESLKVVVVDKNQLILQAISFTTPIESLASKEEIMKFVDSWLKAKNLNAYGDDINTMYMGGTPLFNEATGESIDRLSYLLKRLDELEVAIREEFGNK